MTRSRKRKQADEPPSFKPYEVLGIVKTATPEQVRTAYRRKALKHHPDKATNKAYAHTKFQEIALAYAVLSDERRRKHYDRTGSTDESLSEGDFDWATFYSEQYRDAVSAEKIEAFAKEYRNTEEEVQDVLAAFKRTKGNMSALYEFVMLSAPEADEDRFRVIIDAAIERKQAKAYKLYTKETTEGRDNRIDAAKETARSEAREAEELVEELGLKNEKSKKADESFDLAAAIQKRQAARLINSEAFFGSLEEKYGARPGKRALDEPSEEAFLKNRMKKSKVAV